MDCSMPDFPVHHQLLELAETPVHPVSYAIQPSHPLLSPSPPVFNLSQHQGLFQWVSFFALGGRSIGASASTSVLPQWIFRTDFLYDWLVWSLCIPKDCQESSPTLQFKRINSSVLSFLYGQPSHPYMTTEKTIALTRWNLVSKVMSLLFSMLSRLVITFLPRSKLF